jgi:hypothetical protein
MTRSHSRALASVAALLTILAAAAVSGPDSRGASAAPAIDVYPVAGTTTAGPGTQISFRGARKVSSLTVTGSKSGKHGGRVREHSDGRGFSFVPTHRFEAGERVTVRAAARLTGARSDGSVRFRILTPPVKPVHGDPSFDPGGTPPEAQSFHSRRDLRPPNLQITTRAAGSSTSDLFLAVKSGPGQDGPMIRDALGRLIWFRRVRPPLSPYDFRAQTYRGRPVLTWWQGPVIRGKGQGYGVILDSRYRHVKRVYAGNGFQMDQHEFEITPRGTAFITVYEPVRYDLSSIGGPRDATTWDSIVQEIDIRTGLVLFEWHSLAHVSVRRGTFPVRGRHAYDPFHVNSVSVEGSDRLLFSARNTNALFDVDRHTGAVLWQLGGKRSSFHMGPGTAMVGQHQAIRQPDGTITVFDNGGSTRFHGAPNKESRGVRLRLDEAAGTVSLVREYRHPGEPLFTRSQGSMQVLPSGNVFIGWGGGQPYVTEFSSAGKPLFEAHFLPPKEDTYRAYRLPWHGAHPVRRPDVRASRGTTGIDVYVSWNGATDVRRWELMAGDDPHALKPVKTVAWRDFETDIKAPGTTPRYVAVRALDVHGSSLGTSATVEPRP